MSLDARVEVRFVLERLQAQIAHFLTSDLVPQIEAQIKKQVEAFDADSLIRDMVRREFEATVRKLIEAKVHSALWKQQERLEKIITRIIREEAK